MVLLEASQVRAWDEYTIENEPLSSLELMERAATACFDWLNKNGYTGHAFSVYCGKGNNGGDGLALARLLADAGNTVTVYIVELGRLGNSNFQSNLQKLQGTTASIHILSDTSTLYEIPSGEIVVDALLGTGLNRPLEGHIKALVCHINHSGREVISIDMPSGVFADSSSKGNTCIKAQHTLTFQCLKLAFIVAENEIYTGKVHVLDIGLKQDFLSTVNYRYRLLETDWLKLRFKGRHLFSHKGKHGNAAIFAGGYGMMGAAILASKACLRSGVGKLTAYVPAVGISILQSSIPEVICKSFDSWDEISKENSLPNYDAIGVGPGIGQQEHARELLVSLVKMSKKPVVLDADALNILSNHNDIWKIIPAYSIITPHVKELERLFGPVANDFDRIKQVAIKAKENQVVIVLKGHYTVVADPIGNLFFNTTGNPGLAKAGSGDVLTGMIVAFLSQGYSSLVAACLGVHLHGLAADKAVMKMAQESLLASDTIEMIGTCFSQFYSYQK